LGDVLIVKIDGREVRVNLSSPEMAEGETVVWRHVEHRGLILKRRLWETVITNYRVFKYNYERGVMVYCHPLVNAELVVTLSVAKPLTAYGLAGITSKGLPVFLSKKAGVSVTGYMAVVAGGKIWDEFMVDEPQKVRDLAEACKSLYRVQVQKPILEARLLEDSQTLEISPLDPSLPRARVNLLEPRLARGEYVVRRLVGYPDGRSEVFVTNYRVFEVDLETRSVKRSAPLNSVEFFVVGSRPVRRRKLSKSILLERGWLQFYKNISSRFYFRVGDVVALVDGSVAVRLENVLDPDGFKRLVDTVKRQLYGAGEAARPSGSANSSSCTSYRATGS